MRSVLAQCDGSALRAWAVDLPPRPGGTGETPKHYVAARARSLAVTLMAVPARQRHMYEIVRAAPCWAYFDLELVGCASELQDADERAAEVARFAALYLADAARLQLCRNIAVEIAAMDSHRLGKFSRHLICRAHAVPGGEPVLLRSPTDAAALARLVAARLPGKLIDHGVYAADRYFRLVGSSKLASPTSRLVLNAGRSAASLVAHDEMQLFLAACVAPELDVEPLLLAIAQDDVGLHSHRPVPHAPTLASIATCKDRYYLLLPTPYSLLTTYYLLLTTYYSLLTTHYSLTY